MGINILYPYHLSFEMSLLRSEAGLNCFIRSSAGLRLEAAEREEKERWC